MKTAGTFQRRSRGFTLIELMVVVAIVAILALVAIPSYRSYIVKANRSAAESYIMSVANKQEQYRLDTRAYATTLAALGTSAPTEVSTNYSVTIPTATATAYTITATPTGTQLASDTLCGAVSIDQTGNKSIGGTGTPSACW